MVFVNMRIERKSNDVSEIINPFLLFKKGISLIKTANKGEKEKKTTK